MRLPVTLILLFAFAWHVEGATLTGRVVDAAGEPLAGVTVEAETNGGPAVTTTDSAGRYSLTLTPGDANLTFRLFGFATAVRSSIPVVEPGGSGADVVMLLELTANIVVTGKASFRNLAELDTPTDDLIGIADSSSAGVVGAGEIERRAVQRPGEVLETIPGVVISQHSGEGKANQYYLRGFNLDHGTDFAISVAGVPVNMPSHGHGQGYADANFLIPELISAVQFRKGPYFAESGDFASAGAADISYVNRLEAPVVLLQGGAFGYRRALAAGSADAFGGIVLGAVESVVSDGPWSRESNLERTNAMARYTYGDHRNAWSVTAMSYRSRWNATDQIPARAVATGRLGRFDAVDDTNGGETDRTTLAVEWQRTTPETSWRATAYAMTYGLDLYSNFTYFLDDPLRGDQFQQVDDRAVAGGTASHRWRSGSDARPAENLVGAALRFDDIDVGLHLTSGRARFETVREDKVRQASVAIFAERSTTLTRWLRVVGGVRADFYSFNVASADGSHEGDAGAGLLTPKLSMIFGPWSRTELYLNYGHGFHSNDARGTTARFDPVTGEGNRPVDPLVRTRGAEAGVRARPIPSLLLTSSVWALDLDSELLFVGDAGTTEPTRPSRRRGVEVEGTLRLSNVLLDAAAAWSRARYSDDEGGSYVPGSVGSIASIGAALLEKNGWSGEVRYRLVGERPLVEDGSTRSSASHLVSARVSYLVTRNAHLHVDLFNVLDADASDIEYLYTSRLPGEPDGGYEDVHTHPAEPRSLRVTLRYAF